MNWMERIILRAPEGDGSGGGSGDGKGSGDVKGSGDGKGSGSSGGDDLNALRAQNKALEERLAKLEGSGKSKVQDDPDLQEKARREAAEKDKKNADSKAIESALKFSLGAKDWLKTNATLLPKEVEGIFEQSEKEKYDSAIEKDQAIKASLIQSFFNLQSNLDLLTTSQKSALEDFLKLTKNGKQEKAQTLYESIFEPTFEMLKRIKKAEQIGKAGYSTSTDADQAYRDRMMKLSKKHYMGEKTDA